MSESVIGTTDTNNTPRHAVYSVGEVLFGKFKIFDKVQESDYSTVYAARDLSNNEQVLIESINTEIPSGLDTFARLAKDSMALDHPNVLRLIAYEQIDNRPYLVWEFVDFVRLQDLIDNGGFIEQESEIFETISQICQGLQYAHDQGIAHGYLHPRNVCLADIDGEIRIKLANFGFSHLQHQLNAYEGTGVLLQPKPENDIYHLSVLTYFVVTGESPNSARSLDDILNPRSSDKVSFETVIDQRSDMRGYEELAQLLDDTLDPDEDWRISSPKEFEDGLTDWMNSVKTAQFSTSMVAEKLVEDQQKPQESPIKKKRKITNNMRTTVRQMVNLKSKQGAQEETAVMKLTNIAAAQGPRQSPMASVIRLSIGLVACLTVVGIALYAAFVKPNETKEAFVGTSEKVASLIGKKKPVEEFLPVDEIPVPTNSKKPAASGPTPVPVAAPADEKPKNKLPKFDHNSLRDLYRKDFNTSNNQGKRAFRIEYREFKKEWIGK